MEIIHPFLLSKMFKKNFNFKLKLNQLMFIEKFFLLKSSLFLNISKQFFEVKVKFLNAFKMGVYLSNVPIFLSFGLF